uniref:FBD domain-containing protein n=1 Tax=Acrobeloides nanus TaxID=290746 RepID=A0A914DFE0_9BILA
MRKLMGLVEFEFNCKHDMLCHILASMRHHNVVLPKIQKVNFSMRHSSPNFIEALIWFLYKHKTLVNFRIHNALFATLDQLSRFYGAIISLPCLSEIVLENCSICDRLDKLLEIRFSDELKRKGITCNGQVKSMRFDPDNNH